MKKVLFFFLMFFTLMSCKMQELYLNVIEPAPVTLPPEASKAGIADRSEAPREAKLLDMLEKVLTLEGAELDRTGAQACLNGLTETLTENKRFEKVIPVNEKFPAVNLAGVFPPPLTWQEVEHICRQNDIDLLFSLEAFDTDTRINYQVIKGGNPKTILGILAGVEHRADMQILVKSAWRIYYPAGRSVVDEFPIFHSVNFSASGVTPVVAAAALIDRKEAVKKTGLNAGYMYGKRIIPYQITVERDYYVKGSEKLRIAMRKARIGNWDGAGELWKAETANSKPKIAARACYNMAIFAEIKGSLEVAIEWTKKAYEEYNLRKALRYRRILENRRRKDELLQYQDQR